MLRPYPGADTPAPSWAYLPGIYHMLFAGVEFVIPDSWPKLVCRVRFTLLAPDEVNGAQYTESFFLGTDQDPEALDPCTWGVGTSPNFPKSDDCLKINDLVKKAGIVQGSHIDVDIDNCIEKQLQIIGKMSKRQDKKGVDRNRVNIWYTPGADPKIVPKIELEAPSVNVRTAPPAGMPAAAAQPAPQVAPVIAPIASPVPAPGQPVVAPAPAVVTPASVLVPPAPPAVAPTVPPVGPPPAAG